MASELDCLLASMDAEENAPKVQMFVPTGVLPPPPTPLDAFWTERTRVRIEKTDSGAFKKFVLQNPNADTQGEIDTNKRLMVVEEMLLSEIDYVHDLAHTVQGFLVPLRNVLTQSQDIPVIFGNIELIHSVNTDLLAKLNNILYNETQGVVGTFPIGHIFLEMSNNLLCYEQYCTNYKEADLRLQKCLKQPSFSAEVEKCRNRLVGNGKLLHLPDLLIKPIQRICKYPLLFKELLKYTPEAHPDYIPLKNTLTKLEAIANKINESKAELENMQTLLGIQHRVDGFEGKLAEPGRVFSMEGDLLKMNPRGKIQSRHFFLFSDMLIWSKPKPIKKNHYQFKGMVRLDLAVVRDTPDTKNLKNRFQIIKLETKKIYNLLGETPQIKQQWMSEIDRLISIWLEKEKVNNQNRDALHRMNTVARINAPNSPNVGSHPLANPMRSFSSLEQAAQLASSSNLNILRSNRDIPIPSSPSEDSPIATLNQNMIESIIEANQSLSVEIQALKAKFLAQSHAEPKEVAECKSCAQLTERVNALEAKLTALLSVNELLHDRVAELETSVNKQSKNIRKLRKGPSAANVS